MEKKIYVSASVSEIYLADTVINLRKTTGANNASSTFC